MNPGGTTTGSPCFKGCKWCAKGECWKSGQIPKDPNYVAPTKVKKTTTKKPAQSGNQPPQMQQMLAQLAQVIGGGNGGQAGQVMKLLQGLQQNENQGDNSKSLLAQWVAKQTGKAPTKAEFIYSTFQVPDVKPDQFVSHLVIATIDPSRTYSGEASPSKKAAENSAAAAVLKENGVQGASAAKKSKKKKKKAIDAAAAA